MLSHNQTIFNVFQFQPCRQSILAIGDMNKKAFTNIGQVILQLGNVINFYISILRS